MYIFNKTTEGRRYLGTDHGTHLIVISFLICIRPEGECDPFIKW